ncbi:MAG: UDP-N-acetylmuramate--L-alanine ligase [Candidatus Aminicenantes bacterium]|nr:UDP-N-acetylmuramate--L-alanine ligase [Candidatus Aminicenantes bacterium]
MIEYSRIKKIHFVGIGGSGMSGIAEVLHNMGFEISGSDVAENYSVNRLRSLGVTIYLGHGRDQVKNVETLVYSSAITRDNIEVQAALERKIPVISRAEMLSELMRMKFSIAIAGTHGKTTTTSMISTILSTADKDPTFVVGGKLKIEESGAKLGKSTYLIAEADESDGSFLKLFPTIAVITNIEDDHIDYYKTMDNLKNAFIEFCNKVPFYGSVIVNSNCENSRIIIPALNKRVITYGTEGEPFVKADRVRHSIFQASYDLILGGRQHGQVILNVGGFHNVMNSLAAITAAYEIGLGIPIIKEGLRRFFLPERRFQVLFFNQTNLVVDDYAHHPTEITATIETLKTGGFKRLIVVFQPHRFTRLKLLADKFSGAFSGADQLIITKLYAAGQKKIENVNSQLLVEKIRESGSGDVLYLESFDEISAYLKKEFKKGDAIAFLSAGDLTELAHQFGKWLEATGKPAGEEKT